MGSWRTGLAPRVAGFEEAARSPIVAAARCCSCGVRESGSAMKGRLDTSSKSESVTDAPVLLVGTGRCGSTIVYSLLAMHPDFAWIPSWVSRFPGAPWLAVGNRIWALPGTDLLRETRGFPKPVEPNRLISHWFPGYFSEALDDAVVAESTERLLPPLMRVRRWDGRPRLLLKMVGRPVKVGLFERLCNEPCFVHITRELKPTVASLLRVDFYERTGTIEPWPWGCIPEGYWEFYERSGRQPEIVAAIQYALNRSELHRQLLEVPSARRLEVGYSDFVAHPLAQVQVIARAAHLLVDRRYEKRVSRRRIYRGADRKWERQLTAEQICRLDAFEELMAAEKGMGP